MLANTVEPVAIEQATSAYYSVDEHGGIQPTLEFERRYRESLLDLDLDGSTEKIETNVDELAHFINTCEAEQLERLFDGWSMSTDRRLGLSHVRYTLDGALAQLRLPLRLILRGEPHERSGGVARRAADGVDRALEKLALLRGDWPSPATGRWSEVPGRRERRLIASLGASRDAAEIYQLAEALARAVLAAAECVERLDAASVADWHGSAQEGGREVAADTRLWCARIRRTLSSLGDEDVPVPVSAASAREAIAMAASELIDLVDLLVAFGAAIAGVFRGIGEATPEQLRPASTRQASVLVLDIAGVTVHGEVRQERSHNQWVNQGLDLAAQWTRAFDGWEMTARRGDELTVEFRHHCDAAVLAAAATLRHARALRGIGVEEISWRFHCGVDSGRVSDGENNLLGRCINRAAKICKHGDGRTAASEIVLHSDAGEFCSRELRGLPRTREDGEVSLGSEGGEDLRTAVGFIDSSVVFATLTRRLLEVSARALEQLPSLQEMERPLQTEPIPSSGEQRERRQAS